MKTTYAKNQNQLPAANTVSTASTNTISTGKQQENNRPAFREHPKYDEKYCKEYEATFAGVFFFVIPILFMVFCVLKAVKYEGYNLFVETVLGGGLLLRVIATIWVAKVSRDLNRKSMQWMAFSFLLPGSALMIIGQKKKIYNPSEWKKHLFNHNRSITPAVRASGNQQPLQMAS